MYNNVIRGGDERDLSIDFIRGVAILLVVLGHNIQYASGAAYLQNESYFYNGLFKLIYSFHMPLFALLSGWLYFWSFQKPSKDIIKKRVYTLVIPVVTCVTLEWIIREVFFYQISDLGLFRIIYRYMYTVLHSLWFLWAMFWCSLIVLLVERKFGGKWYFYLLILMALLFVPGKHNLSLYIYMYPYFVSGFMFHKFHKRAEVISKLESRSGIICIGLVFVGLFLFYDYDTYIYTTGISLLEHQSIPQLENDLYRWLIGWVGAVWIILLCRTICRRVNNRGIKLIAYFGKNSLGIYILNYYSNIYILSQMTVEFVPNLLLWILETGLSMLLYSIVIEIIKKNTISKKLLLGGR